MNINDIDFIINAHQHHPTKLKKAFRKWDGKTPYSMHPIWCSATLLTETKINDRLRNDGAQALLYHDVLEDTTLDLPKHLPPKVVLYIKQMTFPGGSQQEMKDIWDLPPEIRLFKLYDKVSNFLDGTWMPADKKEIYIAYIKKLTVDVRTNYGELNIVKIAEALIE